MLKDKRIRTLIMAIFTLTFAFTVALSPAAALGGLFQEQPPVQPPGDGDIIIVPDTGRDTNIFVDNWLLLVIIGIVLLLVIVALAARGGGTTIVERDRD
jgi:hypothetical protein